MNINTDTITLLISVGASTATIIIWLNHQIRRIEKKLNGIEKELVAIKTVMFAHGMPVPSTATTNTED